MISNQIQKYVEVDVDDKTLDRTGGRGRCRHMNRCRGRQKYVDVEGNVDDKPLDRTV